MSLPLMLLMVLIHGAVASTARSNRIREWATIKAVYSIQLVGRYGYCYVGWAEQASKNEGNCTPTFARTRRMKWQPSAVSSTRQEATSSAVVA